MKQIIADASSLIALSENCLLWVLNKIDSPVLIPPYVKKEVFDKPIFDKKYGLEAMRTGLLLGKKIKVIETDPSIRDRVVSLSNQLYKIRNRPLEIIHRGEADAIALLKKNEGVFLVDEKNTRLIIEDREILRRIMETRMRKTVTLDPDIDKELDSLLKGIKVIRSADLIVAAVKNNLIDWPYDRKELLKNLLFALKFSGCAITETEIYEYFSLLQ